MLASLIKRLFVALVLIGATALACWRLLPRWGIDVPWWVPLICFGVIAFSTLATIERESDDQADEEPGGPLPFRPPTDDGGPEGISSADRDRFG